MYRRILVPLDGSKLAERALPAAEELARLMQAPLHLVRVIDPAQWDLSANGADEAEGLAADSYLARMTQRAVAHGIGARGEVRYGNTVREIVSATQPGDLLVMSTHGRGGLARWFLGSVAEAVIRHAPVPLLLIRVAPDDQPERNLTT